jgi:FimV-like protein
VQAEQTLRDAIVRAPDRIELKLKLLEVLKVLARSEAFLELAAEVRAVVAARSPEEAHLEKLIRESPFSDYSTARETPIAGVPTESGPPTSTVSAGPVSAQGTGVAESVADEGIAFEFDFDEGPDPEAPAGQTEVDAPAPTSGAQDAFGGLELELESPFGETESVQTGYGGGRITPPEVAESPNDPGMPSEPDQAPNPETEEKTQLELANAYLEMGDPAAAREILSGLSASEDPAIARRAEELLSNINR